MRSAWKWFSAKTLYRVEVKGDPVALDECYDPEGTLLEERVILVRARSHEEAISKAEHEAEEYASASHFNPYGQEVIQRVLSCVETFELYDDPANRVEVWSSTSVISSSITDEDIITHRFGPAEDNRSKRKKYLNQEFSGQVKD